MIASNWLRQAGGARCVCQAGAGYALGITAEQAARAISRSARVAALPTPHAPARQQVAYAT